MRKLLNVPLVPEITGGTWEVLVKVKLHTLSDLLLRKQGISNEISECFQLLGVTVLSDFPSWFPEDKISSWLHTCQRLSINRLLSQLWEIPEREEMTKMFNDKASGFNRDSFLAYMSQFADLDISSRNCLKGLQIFRQGYTAFSNSNFTSVNENRNFITVSDIPIKLPKTFIIASSNNHHLLSMLDAKETNRNTLLHMILTTMQNEGYYTQEESNTFMLYFLENFYNFEPSNEIIKLAGRIIFLKTDSGEMRPVDLFNPDNEILQDLFQGEKDKMPIVYEMTERQIKALKKLGLKDTVCVKDIAASAAWIHTCRNNYSMYEISVRKSQAILQILNKQTGLLDEQYQSSSLKKYLNELCFITCSLTKPQHFPDSLKWYQERFCKPEEARNRNYENECLVGTTMPLIDSSFKPLDQKLGWDASPDIEKVVKQLLHIRDSYVMQEKSNFLPLVKKIYKFMSENLCSVGLDKEDIPIWTGENFESPAAIITFCTTSDIQDLSPYFYKIPPELGEFIPFFVHVGCNPAQTVTVLQQALHKIRDKYKENYAHEDTDRDMDIVIKILEKLAERRDESRDYDVLLPVQTMNANHLQFHPAPKCTADKNAATYHHEEGDSSIVFVDSRIPSEIAEILGAKSMNRQILSGTESMGIEGFGQDERLTDRISKLITDSYRDGLSVPKELIQNADDAGATVVKFVYDEREHQNARKLLLTPTMADCQGPAILIYNNATFSKADFANIKKLSGATKAPDAKTIGRFGLGFCAVYNLTDLPSFVSKFSVVIFDPQKKYLNDAVEDSSPGIKIDFSKSENEKLLRIHRDQFEPYDGLFGCDMNELPQKPFQGTLFRLPLRTTEQSQCSEISNIAYNKVEVDNLLTLLIENAGNMLLFTQNIEKLELYHIPKDSQTAGTGVLLFSITKDLQSQSSSVTGTILHKVSTQLAMQQQFADCQRLSIDLQLTKDCVSMFPKFKHDQKKVKVHWLLVWTTGTKESLDMSNEPRQKGAAPLSAVAVPTDSSFSSPLAMEESGFSFYLSGYLFCFLPLPIETKLPFHVNGTFEVTSDRKGLRCLTDDDKIARKSNWNEYILIDATVNALFAMLEHFTFNSENSQYTYYQLWPSDDEKIIKPLHDSFYSRIVNENKSLFYGQGRWVTFSDVTFLDPNLQSSEIGNHVYEMLCHFGLGKKVIVDIPEPIVRALSAQHDIEQNTIKEVEFLDIFLLSLQDQYWMTRTNIRNKILIFAIKLGNRVVQERLKNCLCVPVQGHEMFKKPCELVNPEKDVARLFTVKDAVFPSEDLQHHDLLLALSDLGMIGEMLTFDMLVDRFLSVRKLAEQGCTFCSLTRCRRLLSYMSRHDTYNTLEKLDPSPLAEIHSLPVLSRPQDWKFSWFADTDDTLIRIKCISPCSTHADFPSYPLVLGKPKVLYRQSTQTLGGMITSIIDENILKDTLYDSYPEPLDLLHVKKKLSNALITTLLSKLHTEYTSPEDQYEQLHKILIESFVEMQKRMQTDDLDKRQMLLEEIEGLKNIPIILVEKTLYAPEKVVFKLKKNCCPHLLKLPDFECYLRKELYQAIGVRETFTVENIIEVLKEKKELWEGKICEEVETIKNILENLENLEEVIPDSCRDYLIAPDAQGYLLPISDLVLTDDSFDSNIQMHVVHSSIPHLLAEKLGAKRKRRKCYEDISIGISFGQKEKLVSRLQNILSAYPCDYGIMKELLQNADDAYASEIHFIKDYRSHGIDKIFAKSCGNLQGPSLCVYNNSYFTKEDLQGIQDLGDGSKASDPTKTGQYGVGFNCVYHITDTPSFMSKGPEEEILCIFDPLCSHLPGVSHDEPGILCKVSDVRSNFQDTISGFLEEFDLFHNNKGTLFRLPLRTKKSEISDNCLSVEELDKLFHEMTKDVFEVLLFVKNVECIKVSNVSSGQMVEEYCLRVQMSDENKRKRQGFFKFMKEKVKQANHDVSKLLQIEARNVSYEVTITDSTGECERYFVVQRLGFPKNTEIPCAISEAYKENKLGFLPLGGIAHKILTAANVVTETPNIDKNTGESTVSCIKKQFKIDSRAKFVTQSSTIDKSKRSTSLIGSQLGIKSRIFCYLPLPGVIPIPVHINGHFALDLSRRGLWKSGERQTWNKTLMRYVIIPAYVEGISHWKKMFSAYEVKLKTWTNVSEFSHKYHFIFPEYKYGADEDDYWSLLTKYLFEVIIQENHTFFPVCVKEAALQNEGEKPVFRCKWVPLGQFGVHDLGYFNILKKLRLEREDQYTLESILKDLGMNIVNTPHAVKKSIEKSGLTDLSITTPEAIVSFLTTFKNGPCHIGGIDSLLSKTRIHNNKNLGLLVRSIKNAENFSENIEKLPVLLTEDMRLRIFKKESKVYDSEFCWMFSGSEQHFIQKQMKDCYPIEDLLQKDVVRPFTLQIFKELIPDDIRCKLNRGSTLTWNDDLKTVVCPKWITSFWHFLYSKYEDNKSTTENETVFKDFVQDFSNWAVLPSKGKQFDNLLIPLGDAFKLLNVTYNDNYSLYNAVTSLELPQLDSEIFYENLTVGSTIVDIAVHVKSLLTSFADPTMLLKCLHVHNRAFGKLTASYYAVVILRYFSDAIENKKLKLTKYNEERLMALPLYETHDGLLIRLLSNAYVVPSNVPTAGFSEFAKRAKIHLLKKNPSLDYLYKTLPVQSMPSCEFYSKVIVSNIRCLPREFWIEHLTFIKEDELKTGFDNAFSENQKLIINSLKQLDFIDTRSGPKNCDQFFNQENTVFKMMCTSDQFLPTPFQSDEWMPFIALLGMPMDVTDELMIQFAETIANAFPVNEGIRRKSEVLLQCFLEKISHWESTTLSRICHISFVLPAQVCDMYRDISQRKDRHAELICMKGSVEIQNIDICWSTKNVLPFDIESEYHAVLGIDSPPSLQSVLQHFQNISTEIASKLNAGIKLEVENLMFKMYDFLNNHKESPLPQIKLNQFPVIHLPTESKMMSLNCVVLKLNQSQELKPYLYKAPELYSKFFVLFEKLGTSVNVQCYHYLQILEQIHTKTYENPLTVRELGTVGDVLEQLQNCMKTGDVECQEKKLYLPNQNKCLFLSNDLTVWDNELLKKRMKMITSIKYFIGFRSICPSIKDPVEFVNKLPNAIRPRLLSEITDEKLNIDRNSVNQHSIAAYRMMSFIQSQEFTIGVCRIKKHHSGNFDTENDVKKVQELLHSIRILEVSTLETYLEYKGQKVENSDEQCDFFHEEETRGGEKVINFFF